MVYEPPAKGRPFIAYEKKARAAAGPDGQTVRAGPSVYIREHADVNVAAYKEKTKATDDGPLKTGQITFDAESVGVKHDSHRPVQTGSKAAKLLAGAFKNDLPVTVAMETTRHYKENNSGELISPTHPYTNCAASSATPRRPPPRTPTATVATTSWRSTASSPTSWPPIPASGSLCETTVTAAWPPTPTPCSAARSSPLLTPRQAAST